MDPRSFRDEIKKLKRNKDKEWIIFGDRHILPNELTHEDITYLISCIRNNYITTLYLANLDLTDTQVLPIIETLKSDTNITTLALSFNKLGDKSAMAIAELLKKNSVITKLILFRNHITDIGMKAIADALQKNKTLQVLELFDNWFTPAAGVIFKEVLEHNQHIGMIMLDTKHPIKQPEPSTDKKQTLSRLSTFSTGYSIPRVKPDLALPTSKSTSQLQHK